jgi:mannosyltransferase OCH1-like enzyme
MIPKKIHYVWVGGKELSDMAKRCITSWREKLPDFEIIQWDEKNSPMDHPYVKAMYDQKLWAFVSDYVRFWVLEREGGIYMDTDMLVLTHFDDSVLGQTFLAHTPDGFIGSNIIGAGAHDSYIQDVLAYYDRPDKAQTPVETSPVVVTKIYNEKKPGHVKVYDTKYFNPCSEGEKRTPEKLKDAYADHLWGESWVRFRRIRKLARKIGIMGLFQKFKPLFPNWVK